MCASLFVCVHIGKCAKENTTYQHKGAAGVQSICVVQCRTRLLCNHKRRNSYRSQAGGNGLYIRRMIVEAICIQIQS